MNSTNDKRAFSPMLVSKCRMLICYIGYKFLSSMFRSLTLLFKICIKAFCTWIQAWERMHICHWSNSPVNHCKSVYLFKQILLAHLLFLLICCYIYYLIRMLFHKSCTTVRYSYQKIKINTSEKILFFVCCFCVFNN